MQQRTKQYVNLDLENRVVVSKLMSEEPRVRGNRRRRIRSLTNVLGGYVVGKISLMRRLLETLLRRRARCLLRSGESG